MQTIEFAALAGGVVGLAGAAVSLWQFRRSAPGRPRRKRERTSRLIAPQTTMIALAALGVVLVATFAVSFQPSVVVPDAALAERYADLRRDSLKVDLQITELNKLLEQGAEARKEADDARARHIAAIEDVQCELDGTCGSGTPGTGAEYVRKKAVADQARTASDQADARARDLQVLIETAGKHLSTEQANLSRTQNRATPEVRTPIHWVDWLLVGGSAVLALIVPLLLRRQKSR
jgi:hypothetical protein